MYLRFRSSKRAEGYIKGLCKRDVAHVSALSDQLNLCSFYFSRLL